MVYPRIRDPDLHALEPQDSLHRYDYPHLWPSSQTLHIEFSLLATINAVSSTFVFLLILALLRSKRVMSNVFNLYLLGVAIPDFLVSFFCFFTCVLSAPQSSYYSEWMCGFQSFYLNWAFITNAWLNGVVVYQIHRMLRHSQGRRRYIPPTRKEVLTHTGLVYAYAFFWGLLCGFNFDFLPHSSHLYYGFACMPMEYSRASTLFFWLVYEPFTLVLPLLFAVFVTADIIKNKLLPPTGKRRALAMFLLRLCMLYFSIWFPFLVLILVGNFVPISPVVHWSGAAISHLQGLFSALFCLAKPDIKRSFLKLVTCKAEDLEDVDSQSMSNLASRRLSLSNSRTSQTQYFTGSQSVGRSQNGEVTESACQEPDGDDTEQKNGTPDQNDDEQVQLDEENPQDVSHTTFKDEVKDEANDGSTWLNTEAEDDWIPNPRG